MKEINLRNRCESDGLCFHIRRGFPSGMFRGKVTESNGGSRTDPRDKKMVGLYPPSQIPFRFLVHLILLKIFFFPLYRRNVRFFYPCSCKIKARILFAIDFSIFLFLNCHSPGGKYLDVFSRKCRFDFVQFQLSSFQIKLFLMHTHNTDGFIPSHRFPRRNFNNLYK